MWNIKAQAAKLFVPAVLSLGMCVGAHASDTVSVGALRFVSSGPLFVAKDLGYFAEQGIDVNITFFEAATPIAVAVTSGDIDIGIGGLTAGFYNLANKGGLKIIAAQARETPGYQVSALLVSNKAWDAGLRTPTDLPGHTLGITQKGSTMHYTAGLLAAKYGFDLKAVKFGALQSIPNLSSAIAGGAIDAVIIPTSAATPLIEKKSVHLMGWTGDMAPWQLGAVFASPGSIAKRQVVFEKFIKAYQKGAQTYHDALLQRAAGKLVSTAQTEKVIEIVSKHTGLNHAQILQSISYIDPKARLWVSDIKRQIQWYQSQRLLDPELSTDKVLDLRFIPEVYDGK